VSFQILDKTLSNLFRKAFRICSEKLSEFVQKTFQNLFRKAFRICSEKLSEFVQKTFQNLFRKPFRICSEKFSENFSKRHSYYHLKRSFQKSPVKSFKKKTLP
jgi:hypothetical protein